MYCPTCGSEERQLSQYCRACGTDLRVVRLGLEQPDSITASAVSAREQISRALADRIRQMETAKDLEHVAEDVLPQLEKFLESPQEKRLRRVRAGVITALAGAALFIFLATLGANDWKPFFAIPLTAIFVGLGMVINGLVFTVPRKRMADRSDEARSQMELESAIEKATPAGRLSSYSPTTNDLNSSDQIAVQPSITEHTTHQLKPNKS